MKRLILLVLYIVCFYEISATNYYVGGAGASDNNPGTITQPFATIQKAASVAVAGDVVNIRAGVYRETVVPANSGTGGNPIVFQPDAGAVVVISGLNTADGGWSVHNGSVYKKTVTLPVNGYNLTMTNNTTLLANQVFKDGVMQFEARWPKLNVPTDLLDRSKFRPRSSTSNFTGSSITDNGLPNVPGGLVGGKVWMNGWFLSTTRTITSHTGTTINFANFPSGQKFQRFYYVTGKLGLLTQAKEWHYEAGTLYFWQEGGGSPTGVEYKVRNWGFDLRNRSNITIEGLNFIGCEAMTGNTASASIVLKKIKAKYSNHSFLQEGGDVIYNNPRQTGIKLIGPNCVIQDSELDFGASQGIWLGQGGVASNNKITNYSYEGQYGAAITPHDGTGNQVIKWNTMANLGRSGIDFGPILQDNHFNLNIEYNDIYHFGALNIDVGGIYAARFVNLAGTRIHHNWIHDSKAYNTGGGNGPDDLGIHCGLYLDQATGPITFDHNVMWNNVQSDYYVLLKYTEGHISRAVPSSNIHNNTFNTQPVPGGQGVYASYVTFNATPPHDILRNNICRSTLNISFGGSPGNVANCLLKGIDPNFIGTGPGGLAYRLRAGSPAINAGVAIPGITDGSVGAPDMGAYEFGGADWVPGYTPQASIPPPSSPPVVSITSPANNTSFTRGAAITISANASDANGSVTRVEFFRGATKLGEDVTSPYSFVWNNAPSGTHSITAKATDNESNVTTSTAVSVIVAANTPPTVSITGPANNAQFRVGAPITVSATAADANGSVAKVEFFNGATKIGEDLTSPYTFAWNNALVGTHSLTAVATDNENNATTSAVVNVSVTSNTVPTVAITAPLNNVQFMTGAPITISATASDANGSVTKVEFYTGTTLLGTDVTSPYTFAWNNATTGSHRLTAKATDNENNVTTSSIVNIAVVANNNPNVLVTGPSNNAQFIAGTPITITASASDPNGAVTKVEFFNGTTKLGEDLTAPYTFTWSDASVGSHSLHAKATDNQNGVSTSPSIAIEVSVVEAGDAPVVNAGSDKLVQLPENSVTLAATVTDVPDGPVTDYNWTQESGPQTTFNPFQQEITLTDLTEGIYVFSVTATNANGQHRDEVTVTVTAAGGSTAESQGIIPRAFSPNGDGEDDLWIWPNNEAYANSQLTVMNQSGQVVYEKSSYDNTWDGTLDGKPLEKGQYQYTVTGIKDAKPIQASVRIVR